MSADSSTFDLNDPQTRALARVIISTVFLHGVAHIAHSAVLKEPTGNAANPVLLANYAVSVADNLLHRLSQPEAPAKAE